MNQQISEVEPGLRQALDHLQSVLISGENLEAWAVQRRAFALKHRRLLLRPISKLKWWTRNLRQWVVRRFRWSAEARAKSWVHRVRRRKALQSFACRKRERIRFRCWRRALRQKRLRYRRARKSAYGSGWRLPRKLWW